MAQAKIDENQNEIEYEFEPDFEVTSVPVEGLEKEGVEEVEKIPEIDSRTFVKVKEKREITRSTFALIFLVGFLILLALGLILGFFMEGDQLSNTQEVLLTISGILSGPLGFVVGYYFRRSEE
ncbi:hypothetical protein GF389_05825 [Candidatus Dojkabacteria bacterium]|nr:hypothetical protein [Candidatus Dojkabacteria bacterium]